MPSQREDFEEFARARTPALYRAAWLLCGDHQRAEDLVQDALAKVYVRWHSRLRGAIDNPAAYAHTTLVRTYISAQRRRSTHERPVETLPERPDESPDIALRLTLREALAGLEPLDRATLVLRFLEDRSVAETAAALGVSEGAIRSRTMRALERLRARLGTSLHSLLESGKDLP